KQRLLYFGSRPGMDIDGLGEEVVDLLVEAKLVDCYADLYRLTFDQVAALTWPRKRKGKDGQLIDVQFGELNARKLIDGIAATRKRGLARLLASISVRHVGPRVARLLTRQFQTLDQLMKASVEELADIHEIGQAIAESVHRFCQSEFGRLTLLELENAGVLMEEAISGELAQGVLVGKTFVVTGVLEKFSRDQVKELIEQLGGRASSSVSAKTDFLLAGAKAGSKLTKARSLGVRVLSEDDFQRLLDGADE
ncbi:helix-hairpin-helix domain-containing protein, partial [Rhodopirellula sp.]